MENLGPKLHGALLILKQYVVHQCEHKSKPITGSKCLLSMLGSNNSKHYILATQDRDLQNKVRNVPGVPLLYLHVKTPVLEQPTEASVKYARDKMSGVLQSEVRALEKLKDESESTEKLKQKKKKKKQPNPLSCKKKKTKPGAQSQAPKKDNNDKVEKKKRKRIRIPEHIRQELLKNKTS